MAFKCRWLLIGGAFLYKMSFWGMAKWPPIGGWLLIRVAAHSCTVYNLTIKTNYIYYISPSTWRYRVTLSRIHILSWKIVFFWTNQCNERWLLCHSNLNYFFYHNSVNVAECGPIKNWTQNWRDEQSSVYRHAGRQGRRENPEIYRVRGILLTQYSFRMIHTMEHFWYRRLGAKGSYLTLFRVADRII